MPKRGYLGRTPLGNDASKLRPLMYGGGTPSTPTDHGSLTGLGDDDHCFSADTELLTNHGWMQYKDIQARKTVAMTFNTETGEIEPAMVTGVYVYDNFNELICFQARGTEILVTPAHTMIYRICDPARKPGWKWQRARADQIENMSTALTFPLAGTQKQVELPYSDDYLRLLGWVVSEGNFLDSKNNGYGIRIYQSANGNDDEIRRILQSLLIPFSERTVDNIGRRFGNSQYQTLKEHTIFYIPSWWANPTVRHDLDGKLPRRHLLSMSSRQFRLFMGTMILGDGNIRGGGYAAAQKAQAIQEWITTGEMPSTMTYASKDKRLIDYLQELCVRNGVRTKASLTKKGIWLLHLSNHSTISNLSADRVSYNGDVWCVSVLKNQTLVLRRNGRVFIAGNTQYVHISAARTITAQHGFFPGSVQAPFILGPNALGQTVTGLRADSLNKSIGVSGLGLSGGGALTADRTITLTSSSNPGAAASILASDADGKLYLQGLGIKDSSPYYDLDVVGTIRGTEYRIGTGDPTDNYINITSGNLKLYSNSGIIETSPQLRLRYDTTYKADLTVNASGNLTVAPYADLILDPAGNDVLPNLNYDINLGALNKKYLAIHAAELWVETLVAQDTIATIGGRILVGPTTTLAVDLPAGAQLLLNNSFETAGGGGADVFANWTETAGTGTVTRSATQAHRGSYSCYLVAGNLFDTVVKQQVTVVSGETLYLSGWVYYSGADGYYAVWDNTTSSYLISKTAISVTKNQWSAWKATVNNRVGTTSLTVELWCPTTLSNAVYFDDIHLTREGMITVKYNQMAEGDIAYLEANGKVEFLGVIGSAGTTNGWYLYAVERDLDGTGSNDWYAGDAVFNTGTLADGFIDLYSISSVKGGTQYGPTIVGNVRTNAGLYNGWTEFWALGNLNGLYGYGTNTYGVGLGRYSEGNYITIDNTNGMRFFDADDTVRGQLTSSTWTLGLTSNDHVEIGVSAITFKKASVSKLQLQTDGDLFLGSNLSAAGTTYLSIFANAQTYNSESMGAGDMLIGDNSASKANILWDYSEGQLKFRGGTTIGVYVDTTGALTAGAGNVKLDANGISIVSGVGAANKLKYYYSTTLLGALSMDRPNSGEIDGYLFMEEPANYHRTLWLGFSNASLKVTSNFTTGDYTINASLYDSGDEFRVSAINGSDTGIVTFTGKGEGTINQGANDGKILQFKSSDVAHGITGYAETDTYAYFQKGSATEGGLLIYALAESTLTSAMVLTGGAGTGDTTKSTAARAPVRLNAAKKDTTTLAAMGSNENLLTVENLGSAKMIVDAEGDLHVDGSGSLTTYDDYDDVDLVRGFEMALVRRGEQIDGQFQAWLADRRKDLEQIGIISPEGFYNVTRLQRLQNGALWQLHQRLERIERMLA